MTSSVQDLLRRHEQELLNHPDVQAAVAELQEMILSGYPDADFHVYVQDDPFGVHIRTFVDVEDTEMVTDLYIEREMELQVEERIPIYVFPSQPPHRWMQDVPADNRAGTLAGDI